MRWTLISLLLIAPASIHAQALPKPHAEAMAAHAATTPVLLRHGFAKARTPVEPGSFSKVVYGYLPYWVSDTSSIPWEHLTHLSYFAVSVNADGTLGSDRAWDTAGASLVATGHSYGVQVTLTATLFDDGDIATLLSSATARTRAVENLLALVASQGGDGINIDFELVPKSVKAEFVAFIEELNEAFHAEIPGSHVSLATPAIDWRGSYDYDQLAIHSDGLLIMGYGYHWTGGNPGPLSPISAGSTWTSKDLRWTINDYLTWGGAENRHKFILGLPLYGHDWPATSTEVPGIRASGNASSPVLSACETKLQTDKRWDEDAQTPYKVYLDGEQPRQLFCEDEASLAAKLDLVNEADLGGAMFWAIGYAPASHGVWAAVDERFKHAPNHAPIARIALPAQARVGEPLLLDGSASDDPDGDTLTFDWTATEGPIVRIEQASRAVATAYPNEPGIYRFRLEVDDGALVASAEASVTVTAEQTSPGGGNTSGSNQDSGTSEPSSTASVADTREPQRKRGGCASGGCASGAVPAEALLLLLTPWWLTRRARRRVR